MTSAVPFGEYQRIPVHALIWHCLIIRLQSEVELEDGSGGSDIWLALGATSIFFFLYICKWMISMLPSTIWENLKCCLKLCPHTRIPYRLYNYSPVYICLSNLIYRHFLHLIRWTALSIISQSVNLTWCECTVILPDPKFNICNFSCRLSPGNYYDFDYNYDYFLEWPLAAINHLQQWQENIWKNLLCQLARVSTMSCFQAPSMTV